MIETIAAAVFVSALTGSFSGYVTVCILKNDVAWIKKSIDNLFARVYEIEQQL